MLIRKLFKFENAHIVRGCSSRRCSHSIHGHSYKIEILLEASFLDQGQMIYDFGLLKQNVGEIVDAFDHAVTLWSNDDPDYIASLCRHSERWISIPVYPSAEQFSRLFFCLADWLLKQTQMKNGEMGVQLFSVIVHETETGYAQCFREDAYNENMGSIDIKKIGFSAGIVNDWKNPLLLSTFKPQTGFSESLRENPPEKNN